MLIVLIHFSFVSFSNEKYHFFWTITYIQTNGIDYMNYLIWKENYFSEFIKVFLYNWIEINELNQRNSFLFWIFSSFWNNNHNYCSYTQKHSTIISFNNDIIIFVICEQFKKQLFQISLTPFGIVIVIIFDLKTFNHQFHLIIILLYLLFVYNFRNNYFQFYLLLM